MYLLLLNAPCLNTGKFMQLTVPSTSRWNIDWVKCAVYHLPLPSMRMEPGLHFLQGKKYLHQNELLETFPLKITPSALQSLILSIDNAVLCPGNPDAEYVIICRGRKDGKMSGDRGFGQTIAFIHDSLGDLNRKGSANMYMYMYRS